MLFRFYASQLNLLLKASCGIQTANHDVTQRRNRDQEHSSENAQKTTIHYFPLDFLKVLTGVRKSQLNQRFGEYPISGHL